jgi:hypothetical protein
MAASLTLRQYSGTNAGTESAAVEEIDLEADGGGDVAPGTNSLEAWLRLRVDTAAEAIVSNFTLVMDGAVPTGTTLRFGVRDTGVTPTAATSSIATTEITPGRRYIWDTNSYDSAGDRTRYLVIQAQVAANASTESIETNEFTIGWSES